MMMYVHHAAACMRFSRYPLQRESDRYIHVVCYSNYDAARAETSHASERVCMQSHCHL